MKGNAVDRAHRRTYDRMKARAEAAEAQCARLEEAVHAALAVMSDLYDPLRMSEEDHQRAAELADKLNAALAGAGEPTARKHWIDQASNNREARARKEAEANMRERAAKVADKRRSVTGDGIAKEIRALPLTEGKADD